MSTKAEVVEQVLLANPGATAAKIAELVKAAGVPSISPSSIAQVKGKLVTAGKLQKGKRGRKPKNASENAKSPRAKKAAVSNAPVPVENSRSVLVACADGNGCNIAPPSSRGQWQSDRIVECLKYVERVVQSDAISAGDNKLHCRNAIDEVITLTGI